MNLGMKSWMKNLEENLKNTPLIYLAIPGSHDCMTYTIPLRAELAPDNEPAVKYLMKLFGGIGRKYMHKWCVTQDLTVLEQLSLGIRYLDFRVATKPSDSKIYFCHGLYGDEVSTHLDEIDQFLDDNEGEVVVLDFQHFYSFSEKDHDVLIHEKIKPIFGKKLCPFQEKITDVTLKWMLKNGYRVIVIYRNKRIENMHLYGLWPGPAWPTPWPNTSSLDSLKHFLTQKLAARPQEKGWVTQCLLTPDAKLVGFNIFGNIKKSCALPVFRKVMPWVVQQEPGPSGINVVISDYVSLNSGAFSTMIIGLNNYFLKD